MQSNQDHPFFRPLWRRIAILVATGAWTMVEWYHGESLWATLTLGIFLYSIWTFFITYPKATALAEPSQKDPK